jgi:hypothetical protein
MFARAPSSKAVDTAFVPKMMATGQRFHAFVYGL